VRILVCIPNKFEIEIQTDRAIISPIQLAPDSGVRKVTVIQSRQPYPDSFETQRA